MPASHRDTLSHLGWAGRQPWKDSDPWTNIPRVLEADLLAVISCVLINCPLTLSWQTPRREQAALWCPQLQILPKLRLRVLTGPVPKAAAPTQTCIAPNHFGARNLTSSSCFLVFWYPTTHRLESSPRTARLEKQSL